MSVKEQENFENELNIQIKQQVQKLNAFIYRTSRRYTFKIWLKQRYKLYGKLYHKWC